MRDVFISYSSADSDVAKRIAEDIKRSDLTIFYDNELMPRENWDTRLAQELKRAKSILVLFSPS